MNMTVRCEDHRGGGLNHTLPGHFCLHWFHPRHNIAGVQLFDWQRNNDYSDWLKYCHKYPFRVLHEHDGEM